MKENGITSVPLPYQFYEYNLTSKRRIAAAIKGLGVLPAEKLDLTRTISALIQPLEDAWLVGNFDELMQKVDEVTQNTKQIGHDFLMQSGEDSVTFTSFHWVVEWPDPNTHSLLNIGLWLVPEDSRGCIILTQQILRIEENRYVYWGVD